METLRFHKEAIYEIQARAFSMLNVTILVKIGYIEENKNDKKKWQTAVCFPHMQHPTWAHSYRDHLLGERISEAASVFLFLREQPPNWLMHPLCACNDNFNHCTWEFHMKMLNTMGIMLRPKLRVIYFLQNESHVASSICLRFFHIIHSSAHYYFLFFTFPPFLSFSAT